MSERWRSLPSTGLERLSQVGTLGACAWCGSRKKIMFLYRAPGGRLLSGLMGEGRPFCSLGCFRSYQ